jgi:tRNA threonylcarbamoyl adenosine modification protein YeaZ
LKLLNLSTNNELTNQRLTKKKLILAIETATDVCSVAFENDAGEIFESRAESRGSHSEKLFLFIKALMDEHEFTINDIEAVLVSEGPGSYTGLRIAASGVKGLLFGADTELYGVQTMASFAMAALEAEPSASRIHAIIDARREHVYHQPFTIKDEALEASGELGTVAIASFENTVQPGDVIVGTGMDRLDNKLIPKVRCFGKETISARSLIQLYHRKDRQSLLQKVSAAEFDPKYYTSKQV